MKLKTMESGQWCAMYSGRLEGLTVSPVLILCHGASVRVD